MLRLIAAAATALFWSAVASAQDPVAVCAGEAADAIAAKACLARQLSAAEDDLVEAERQLNAATSNFATVERQRNAATRLGTSQAAWRAHRDLDCQLTAALAPAELDSGVVQVACAIQATQVRAERFLRYAESITPLEIPDERLESFDVADRDDGERRIYFRDWLAACRPDGGCAAATYVFATPGSNQAAYLLRLFRDAPDDAWSVVFAGLAVEPDPNADLQIWVDDAAPTTLAPRNGHRPAGAANVLRIVDPTEARSLIDAMTAGLEARVRFADANGDLHEERFSLRGLSAALDWVDTTQPTMADTADAAAGE